jgi:hypothetical protein
MGTACQVIRGGLQLPHEIFVIIRILISEFGKKPRIPAKNGFSDDAAGAHKRMFWGTWWNITVRGWISQLK